MNRSIFGAVFAVVALTWALGGLLPHQLAADETNEPDSSPIGIGHLRVARPTDHMEEIVRFYRDGLGLEVISSFDDHDGFDGVMLGRNGAPYHLEFTHKRGHEAGRAPGPDNLIVFYLPDNAVWQQAIDRMFAAGYDSVPSFNPYWDVKGKTFEDIDGYRVVLQNSAWR